MTRLFCHCSRRAASPKLEKSLSPAKRSNGRQVMNLDCVKMGF
jgi:hypothetical protein